MTTQENEEDGGTTTMNPRLRMILLMLHSFLLLFGAIGVPLISRLYYLHGGDRIWLSSFLQTCGFPLLFIPLALTYLHRRRDGDATVILTKLRLFLGGAVAGVITGVDDYLYSYGLSRIPVSTASLIVASQLVFTAGFAYLLVRQRFTPYSVNAVVLLTIGAGVLAMNTSGDLPPGESRREYHVGFVMMVCGALLYGFLLPLMEFIYQRSEQVLTYSVVMEFQVVMCAFATTFCLVGMLVNNDFQGIPREAKEWEMGEATYYVVLVLTSIMWQCFYLGAVGVIYCSSSLLSGVIIALALPITEGLAVFFYDEEFQNTKWVSLALSIWGFVSYFYGELRESKRRHDREMQMAHDRLYP